MISFVKGDFFDYDADIRINTVNCVGIMGAGVALAFKNKFPEMYDEYVKICNQGLIKPGKPHVWQSPPLFGSKLIIVNFPTKVDWKKPSEYEYVEKGLIWLREFLINKGNVNVTLPALGCGHGGLDWLLVKELINKYVHDLEANILVFEPTSSTTKNMSEDVIEILSKKNISHILPSDINYPSKLKGISAVEIYIKGDIKTLDKKNIAIITDSKSSEREKSAIIQCVETISNQDITYILGLNSSFDSDLLKEFIIRKLHVIVVLPYGIFELKIRKDIKQIWDNELITTVSLTHPKQTWKSFEGIKALKFRLTISDVVMITNLNIESLEKIEREFSEKKSIFYINYMESKKDFFDRILAKQIGRNRESMLPNVRPILDALDIK